MAQVESQSERIDQTNARTYPRAVDPHLVISGRRDLPGEIYRNLRAAILDGRIAGGERLPATRDLAARLNVSRTTVTTAYDRLISEGYATGRVGSGTYVEANVATQNARPVHARRALRPRHAWESIPLPAVFRVDHPEFDFRAGVPDARLFPNDQWRRLIARQFRSSAIGSGVYGDPAGHLGLREAIARHVGVSRGVRAISRDIVVTNGTQQAVDIVVRVLLKPRDHVAVEDPGFSPIRLLFEAMGARVTAVPVDDQGLIVDALPAETRLVYVSPSHQFPLGMSMSLSRRRALIAWAADHDAAVIEDDYDSEFRYGAKPIEALQTLDKSGRVIYVGSFSKTMLPTLRLGFVIVPESLRIATQSAKFLTDWHTSLPLQAALATFIDDGLFARHVRRMRTVYQGRYERIIDVLSRDFDDELAVIPSSVGLHVSALARTASVEQIATLTRVASAAGVECFPLSLFSAGDHPRAGLLLGYGSIDADQIEPGLNRLKGCFAAIDEPGRGRGRAGGQSRQ
jgi:GntR family transcriptional regulator / MocR family aminotransferase